MKNYFTSFCVLAALFFMGCTTKVTASNGSTVIVRPNFSGSLDKALIKAEAECNKSGKTAKLTNSPVPGAGADNKFIFECVNR